jgi:hypothetical protein
LNRPRSSKSDDGSLARLSAFEILLGRSVGGDFEQFNGKDFNGRNLTVMKPPADGSRRGGGYGGAAGRGGYGGAWRWWWRRWRRPSRDQDRRRANAASAGTTANHAGNEQGKRKSKRQKSDGVLRPILTFAFCFWFASFYFFLRLFPRFWLIFK